MVFLHHFEADYSIVIIRREKRVGKSKKKNHIDSFSGIRAEKVKAVPCLSK